MLFDPLVHELASRQDGLASLPQLRALGVGRHLVAGLVGWGAWTPVLPNVIAVDDVPAEGPDRLLRAWLLELGDASCVTGWTALERHGLRYAPRLRPCLGVPHARRPVTRGGAVAVRSERGFELDPLHRLPVVSLTRALADCCRVLGDDRTAHAVVCEAAQRGLVRLADLHAEALDGPRRTRGPLLRAVDAATAGSWSAPEAEAADLLGAVAPLHRNCLVLDPEGRPLGRPDLHAVGTGVLAEIDSQEHHGGGTALERTSARQAAWAAAGYVAVPLTPARIRGEPARVLAQWRATVERRAPGGDPGGSCRLLDGTRVAHAAPARPRPARAA